MWIYVDAGWCLQMGTKRAINENCLTDKQENKWGKPEATSCLCFSWNSLFFSYPSLPTELQKSSIPGVVCQPSRSNTDGHKYKVKKMWFYYKGITRRVLIIIISAERQRERGAVRYLGMLDTQELVQAGSQK